MPSMIELDNREWALVEDLFDQPARRAGLTEGLYAAPGSAAGARCVVAAPLQ